MGLGRCGKPAVRNMQLMKRALGPGISLVVALAVSACAETTVQDMLGTGKSAIPDASQVTVAQNLAMPPDLQLRAPPDGPTNDNQATAVQAPPEPAQPVQPAAAAPPTQPAPPALKQTQTAAAEQPKQDIYERYGISKTYPDGKPKPQDVLYEELHQAQINEKRRVNPNYGTIWNIGSVFKDN